MQILAAAIDNIWAKFWVQAWHSLDVLQRLVGHQHVGKSLGTLQSDVILSDTAVFGCVGLGVVCGC